MVLSAFAGDLPAVAGDYFNWSRVMADAGVCQRLPMLPEFMTFHIHQNI